MNAHLQGGFAAFTSLNISFKHSSDQAWFDLSILQLWKFLGKKDIY